MPSAEELSWKEQLGKVRGRVIEQQKHRQLEKKLLRQRNEEALRERLAQDTPEALVERFEGIRDRFDHGVRKFYPRPHIELVSEDIDSLEELLKFYQGCIGDFGRLFSPAHRTTISRLLIDIRDLCKGLDRQLKQWREVKEAVDGTVFRRRTEVDNEALVTVAKAFSERAHKVSLSIPGDYFSREGENFWVVQNGEFILGYMKFFPEEKVVSFALVPHRKTNFNKFIRAILFEFLCEGPIAEKMAGVRVRITYVREVKFFTDLGFVRTEVKGPSDWIYQRDF